MLLFPFHTHIPFNINLSIAALYVNVVSANTELAPLVDDTNVGYTVVFVENAVTVTWVGAAPDKPEVPLKPDIPEAPLAPEAPD